MPWDRFVGIQEMRWECRFLCGSNGVRNKRTPQYSDKATLIDVGLKVDSHYGHSRAHSSTTERWTISISRYLYCIATRPVSGRCTVSSMIIVEMQPKIPKTSWCKVGKGVPCERRPLTLVFLLETIKPPSPKTYKKTTQFLAPRLPKSMD